MVTSIWTTHVSERGELPQELGVGREGQSGTCIDLLFIPVPAMCTDSSLCYQMTDKSGCIPGQIALACLLAQGEDVLPITGSTNIKHIDQNVAAANIKLSPEDLKEIQTILVSFKTHGEGYKPNPIKQAF